MSGTPSVSCSYIYRNVAALNYSACSAISAYIDSYDTNTFSDGFKGMELLQWKIHDISMEFFEIKKFVIIKSYINYYF